MHAILIVQAVVCVCRFVILIDFSGGLWMALVVSLGYYAMLQGMNITYVCCWGLMCGVNGIFDVLGFILPCIIGLLKFRFLSTCVRVCIPVSYLAGALFAWHLYLDFEHHRGYDISKFDPMAKCADAFDCEEQTPLQAVGSCVGSVFGSTKDAERKEADRSADLAAGPQAVDVEEPEEDEPPLFPQPCC
mmetsp:Transcript_142633/g.443630  ORF Transcript_142633/g.443630 Transcript_142633/m.443630 type:complete len:189 (-) Transcript_142633:66-632(-)